MERIKLFILEYLLEDLAKGADDVNKDQIDNWVRYCYGHTGFNAYCNARLTSIMVATTDKTRSREAYLEHLGRIKEVRKMRVFVKARFKTIESKDKKKQS